MARTMKEIDRAAKLMRRVLRPDGKISPADVAWLREYKAQKPRDLAAITAWQTRQVSSGGVMRQLAAPIRQAPTPTPLPPAEPAQVIDVPQSAPPAPDMPPPPDAATSAAPAGDEPSSSASGAAPTINAEPMPRTEETSGAAGAAGQSTPIDEAEADALAMFVATIYVDVLVGANQELIAAGKKGWTPLFLDAFIKPSAYRAFKRILPDIDQATLDLAIAGGAGAVSAGRVFLLRRAQRRAAAPAQQAAPSQPREQPQPQPQAPQEHTAAPQNGASRRPIDDVLAAEAAQAAEDEGGAPRAEQPDRKGGRVF